MNGRFPTSNSQIAFCLVYGGTSGGCIGLISVVLIDIIGIEKFVQAYGINLFSQGIARIIGSPIIGKITTLPFNHDRKLRMIKKNLFRCFA